jgi:hypothetical protein
MKLIADSRGRLTAAELFRPNTAFDATLQPDGSIRVVELVEKQVPIIKVKRNKDGTYECPLGLTRDEIRAAIRADRERQ